jgi:hypothetical protein
VGDGYHANGRVDHFMASDCSTTDPVVRRVRADWQFSRYATFETIMANIVCNSWESEPADTQEDARLLLTNVRSRSGFDLAGDATNATGQRQPVRVQLTNVICLGETGRAGLPFVNFFRVHGDAVNCDFRLVDRVQRCKLRFIGCSITVADNGSGVADAVQIWHDQLAAEPLTNDADRFGNYVVFDRVLFLKDPTVTTGQYITISTIASLAGQLGPEMVRTEVSDCHTPEPLDLFLSGSRAGLIEIKGGLLGHGVLIEQQTFCPIQKLSQFKLLSKRIPLTTECQHLAKSADRQLYRRY